MANNINYIKRCEILDYIDTHPGASQVAIAEACQSSTSLVRDMIAQREMKAALSVRQRMECHAAKLEGLINPAVGLLADAIECKGSVTREAVTAAKDVLDRVGPIRAEKSVLSNPDGTNVFTDPGRDRLPDDVLDRLIALAGQSGVPPSPEGSEAPE